MRSLTSSLKLHCYEYRRRRSDKKRRKKFKKLRVI
jgi:hypothetical protein